MQSVSVTQERNAPGLAALSRDVYGDLQARVVKTPLVRLPWLDTPRRRVWAKLENQQLGGSFKYRGALAAALAAPKSSRLVTGSAGNHGLALALASRALSRACRIHLPYNATDVKVKRIQAVGVDIEPAGRDLYDCILQAKAGCTGGDVFISPFEDIHVAAGQGTILLELAEQHEDGFDHLIVPLGGGGLMAGIAAVQSEIGPETKLHAVAPRAFRRTLVAGTEPLEMSNPVFPTVADGLAVQHEPGSWLQPLLAEAINAYHCVDETEMYAAMVSLLNQESLLTEGAGAIGVAALLFCESLAELEGDVCVLLTGGNVAQSRLAIAMTRDFAEIEQRGMLGLRTAELIAEAVRKPQPRTRFEPAQATLPSDRPVTAHEYLAAWRAICDGLIARCQNASALLDSHAQFVLSEGLPLDSAALETSRRQLASARELLEDSGGAGEIRAIKSRYRLALQNYAFALRALDWCSAGNDQVHEVNFLDPAAAQGATVNYDRYGGSNLQIAEHRMARMLGLAPASQAVLLTSSGQAAFTLIESYLTHNRRQDPLRIASVPYIYFEAAEQLASLDNISLFSSSDWSVGTLIDLVETEGCDVVFIDAVANKQTLDQFDIASFAKAITGRGWAGRTIVIDGTMTSGAFDPTRLFEGPDMPLVLYYESLSKYAQLGLDLQMAGIVVGPGFLASELRRLRRNTGTVMYAGQVHLLPTCDRAAFLTRMRRMTQNAQHLTAAFNGMDHEFSTVRARFTWDWLVKGWDHGGAIVTLEFANPGLNNRQFLDALIEGMLQECKRANVALTKGVSFGFSTTRISAAAAMADQTDPFMRISAGDEEQEDVIRLSEALLRATHGFLDRISAEKEVAR